VLLLDLTANRHWRANQAGNVLRDAVRQVRKCGGEGRGLEVLVRCSRRLWVATRFRYMTGVLTTSACRFAWTHVSLLWRQVWPEEADRPALHTDEELQVRAREQTSLLLCHKCDAQPCVRWLLLARAPLTHAWQRA
jgi:hypothetical protein